MREPFRIRFTLRSLLLAITLICALLAYVVVRAEHQRTAVQHVLKLGGKITYAEPPGDEWWLSTQCRTVLPRDYLDTVDRVHFLNSRSGVTDSDLRYVARFSELRALALCHTNVTDRGLDQLTGLKKLQWLTLIGNPNITREGIIRLKEELPDCNIP